MLHGKAYPRYYVIVHAASFCERSLVLNCEEGVVVVVAIYTWEGRD